MEIILYSEDGGWLENRGIYRFVNPIKIVKYHNNKLLINDKVITTDNPLPIIEKLIKNTGFFALGFISYDFKNYIFNKNVNKNDINLPIIYLALFRKYEKLDIPFPEKLDLKIKNIKIPDKNSFISKIKKVKKYIEEGDIYQVNIAHRVEVEGFFPTKDIFFNLIKLQPTPYLMFLKDKEFSLISGSMELFLEKKGDVIISKPIKGTRKRGGSLEEDISLFRELETSNKELSENLMITDLMRNDINRISKGVYVENIFNIEAYSSLFQMVSTVKGKLDRYVSLKEIIYNTFPPGSVTGAPKKRAIEIIDELEDYRRNIYCGANVFIKPDMDFVMSVAIRQSIFRKDKCYIYVGSGIVADSDLESEYKETLIKARANLKAMGIDI